MNRVGQTGGLDNETLREVEMSGTRARTFGFSGMKPTIVVVAALVFLAASCGGGVSQEDYDTLKVQIEAQEANFASYQAEQAVGTQPRVATPAEPTDIDEISRHPSIMPDSARYTLYENGWYLNPNDRGEAPITIEAHFRIREVVAEMVSGTTMDFWTFDGGIPGPMIRGRVGDTIDFYLHNPQENRIPYNVDFHAVTGPGGGAVRLDTRPGAVSRLQVKLLAPGIYIYHCAYPDIPMHISHGMYGLVVVEPEEGLPQVDHEYYVLQSDFYTEMGGEESHPALRDAGHLDYSPTYGNLEEPTFVVFNGRPDSIVGDRALGVFGSEVNAGETVRFFVGNIGPNLVSSFHLIGEIFDRVYVEGSFSLVNQYVQSTLVPAGGAVGVEFVVDAPGDYVLVDHSIFRVHKGALGVIHVEGQDEPDIFKSIEYSDELRK